MIEHLNIRVSGRVQGVCFRAYTVAQARRLGIAGFVRNEEDGTVYIEAEGTKEDLEKMIAACRRGPPAAQVRGVEATPAPLRRFTGFDVAFER